MRISIIINNYNYEKFVFDAIDSVISQTRAADEIIIIDDGSNDGSVKSIKKIISKNIGVHLIEQKNQGQLSAILAGFRQSTGDVICMLDADDLYLPNHLEEVERSFQKDSTLGMRFSDVLKFGNEEGKSGFVPYYGNLGVTAILTYLSVSFIGNVTSSLSFSRKALEKICPHLDEFIPNWKTRADNCLIWGISLAGLTKENVKKSTVQYRIHGNNLFAGKNLNYIERIQYIINREAFIEKFSRKIGLTANVSRWIYREYASSRIRHPERYKSYLKATQSHRNSSSYFKNLYSKIKISGIHFRGSFR